MRPETADGSAWRCHATHRDSIESRARSSGCDSGALEVLVRGAVVAFGERRALARLPLARRRPAPRHPAVEGAGLDLRLDETDRGPDTLLDRPGDLRLLGDRKVA